GIAGHLPTGGRPRRAAAPDAERGDLRPARTSRRGGGIRGWLGDPGPHVRSPVPSLPEEIRDLAILTPPVSAYGALPQSSRPRTLRDASARRGQYPRPRAPRPG